ncbi:hypothetical protein PWT90_01955 [Aphanocladium album]|nr:hypothetical protein PWT90_01955 [Aphanocladium album]
MAAVAATETPEPRQLANEDYTVGWICALTTESVAAQAFLDERHGPPVSVAAHDNNDYVLGSVGRHNVAIAVLPGGEYGTASAGTVARDMVHSFPNIRIGLMVGIGGGAPSSACDIRLGDVVVSEPRGAMGGVFQYDYGKTIQDQPFVNTRFLAPPPQVLLTAISGLRAQYELDGHRIQEDIEAILVAKKRLRKKYSRPDAATDQLYQSDFVHVMGEESCSGCGSAASSVVARPARDDDEDYPVIHYGLVATANRLMKDAKLRDTIAKERGVLCFEMEAGGLMNHFPCLIIRGICDYSDTHKNKDWQGYAAMTAAAYAKDLLKRITPSKVEAESKLAEAVHRALSTSLEIRAGVQDLQESGHFDDTRRWLRAPDPSTNLSKARQLYQPGTGQWLLQGDAYRSWKRDPGSFLWLYGIPGCGKTVLSSTVVTDLDQDSEISRTVLYFYFNFSDIKKRSTENAVRSLIDQLYRKSANARAEMNSLHSLLAKSVGDQPTHSWLQKTLVSMAQKCPSIWVVLDGLDECETRSQYTIDGVLPWIGSLRTALPNMHLLVTSRPEQDISSSIKHWASSKEMIPLQSNKVAGDIAAYIASKMQHMHRWRTRPDVQQLISTALNKRANGMFRWVACQFDMLEECYDAIEVRQALDTLPRTLNETYARAVQRIRPEHKSRAIRLLQILTYSLRPLRLDELTDVMAIEPKERPRFNPANRMPIPEELSRYCPSLVSVARISRDRGFETQVQLAHFSVREYLQADQLEPDWAKHLDREASAAVIAELCLSHRVITQDKAYRIGINNALYAAASQGHEALVRLFIEYGADISIISPDNDTALHTAAGKGHEAIVRILIDQGVDIHLRARFGQTALQLACRSGHLAVVQLLIDSGADVNKDCSYEQTHVLKASTWCNEEVAGLLIQNGADVNARGGRYGNALQAVAFGGYDDVVKILIRHGANVNVEGGEYGTPLQAAAARGNYEAVKTLIHHGADVNARGGRFDTALAAALLSGREDIAKILIQYGALEFILAPRERSVDQRTSPAGSDDYSLMEHIRMSATATYLRAVLEAQSLPSETASRYPDFASDS